MFDLDISNKTTIAIYIKSIICIRIIVCKKKVFQILDIKIVKKLFSINKKISLVFKILIPVKYKCERY